jgi:hypothetical protein
MHFICLFLIFLQEISAEEKLQIAQHYLLNAPPGQFESVLAGIPNLLFFALFSFFFSFFLLMLVNPLIFVLCSFPPPPPDVKVVAPGADVLTAERLEAIARDYNTKNLRLLRHGENTPLVLCK